MAVDWAVYLGRGEKKASGKLEPKTLCGVTVSISIVVAQAQIYYLVLPTTTRILLALLVAAAATAGHEVVPSTYFVLDTAMAAWKQQQVSSK